MFPEELPRRIIKMFTFVGETVLDPFLGSGTTVKVALDLNRNAIGYEINENFLDIIKKKIGINSLINFNTKIEIVKRKNSIDVEEIEYVPRIKDAKPIIDPGKLNFKNDRLYKVVKILDDGSLRLDTGLVVKFRGVVIKDLDRTKNYLKEYVLKKKVYLKFDKNYVANGDFVEAYVYLKNRIFINAFLIKSGFATADKKNNYDLKKRFIELELKSSSENLVNIVF
jgi:hypothetical protein